MVSASGDDALPGVPTFAGDVFLALAAQGRLVLDADEADEAIEGLERTLELVGRRVQLLEAWRSRTADPDFAGVVSQSIVDVVFAEVVAPGRLERALQELPKYLEAMRLAKRRPASTDS
jgi:hypothetical protein